MQDTQPSQDSPILTPALLTSLCPLGLHLSAPIPASVKGGGAAMLGMVSGLCIPKMQPGDSHAP